MTLDSEQHNRELTPRPDLLDVVKIDGRWAQVIIGGNCVRFLDDLTEIRLDWDRYNLVERYMKGFHVALCKILDPAAIKCAEIDNIFWQNTSDYPQRLNLEVGMFGEYKRKAG